VFAWTIPFYGPLRILLSYWGFQGPNFEGAEKTFLGSGRALTKNNEGVLTLTGVSGLSAHKVPRDVEENVLDGDLAMFPFFSKQ